MTSRPLDGPTKAAILMVLLGEETSSTLLQHFEEPEIISIGRAMAALGEIEQDTAGKILHEYRDRILARTEVGEGGTQVARRILGKAFSPDKAAELSQAMAGGGRRAAAQSGEDAVPHDPRDGEEPFAALASVKDHDLAQILELEHPQTAALVLLHLEPGRAASALAAMNEETQASVTSRLSRLTSERPEVTREVSDALAARFETLQPEGVEERDGTGAAAEILKSMDRVKSRSILSRLESLDAECAQILRSRVYTFEMLLLLNDRGVQEVLKGVDTKQLALALKGTAPEVADKFFRNMSTRAADMVKDEIEILGVAKVKDVEAAQKEILDKALRLEEEGTVAFEAPEGAAQSG